ncbi:MAG: carbamoyl-phosphate synthase (glutamine-hydrolyzing) large subunit [Ferroplasma sp.]|uniref:carbamoyl-phosphate synthase (glutamine-hydrolyzing) large subunit n=1 Tax=Ferroplasma sp. TaxID=2591003 RepID=UPI0028152F11|nr:carbamoyl-phosphate synthase (glutamine-hydrolyzing) large subunit [Ferroplasma sp.]WMT50955.1 MAG: carbamoyl-phosphate synthase (glutamine-hydrolyzing) large subunit [Ferroplasma sp.]
MNTDIKCTLVIGSGPIVIGQAAEFDYSGSQACLALKEEGVRTVLLNSNPATIQTDHEIADRVYIEPVDPESVLEIIKKEKIDSILPSTGGQVGLNLVILLDKLGILKSNGIKVLGTPVTSIEIAEDRKKFFNLMRQIGEPIIESYTLVREDYKDMIDRIKKYPLILRTGFSLGGSGGVVIKNRDELISYCDDYFSVHDDTVELDESLLGLKEIEYEMMRDNAGNCISICNMENLDPMGVHTGESIVTTPSLTLTNDDYQKLRTSAIHIVNEIGVIGSCNIQFALNQATNEYYVVEVNPRTSRSSALASKASGYPIARISTKIAMGYNINEIKNPVTKNTYAAFEPSMDYITVKIPRWPFDKFSVKREIGIEMKSIGEAMGIGRTFEEALMKSISSLDIKQAVPMRLFTSPEKARELMKIPNDQRIFAIFDALFQGISSAEISELSGYDEFFVEKMRNIAGGISSIKPGKIPENMEYLKLLGISDETISYYSKIGVPEIIKYRLDKNIIPVYKSIDTCSAEFESDTSYMYSSYDRYSDNKIAQRKKVIVIGSGPNRISQGVEFDYGAVKSILSLRKMGFEAIMVNSNPETVSTDFDISDKLYFEPITLEHISNIVSVEKPQGIIIQFSGQTGQNMADGLSKIFRDTVIGTQPADIFRIEERTKFSAALKDLGIKQPDFIEASNMNELEEKIGSIKLPVIIRSSFIIGGRAMDIIYDYGILQDRVRELFIERPGSPVLVSKYLQNATEIDVDFISSKKKSVIAGISVHIEEAGTHSGDATMVLGPHLLETSTVEKIQDIVEKLRVNFNLLGLSNLQIAIKDGEIYVIELNARSSRSVPFVAKATGINWVDYGIKAMMGMDPDIKYTEPKSYFIKVPVFPFKRFRDMDVILGPEMKSTGEAMCCGETFHEAMSKVIRIMKRNFQLKSVIITVNDPDKPKAIEIARKLSQNGVQIYATPGTYSSLHAAGIGSTVVYRVKDLRLPGLSDIIRNENISMIINTPSESYGSIRDGFSIRNLGIKKDIPLITNIKFAGELVDSILSGKKAGIRELGDYY